MDQSLEEEPAKWRARKKLPFKQVSFGLKQLTETGIAQHMKQLEDALVELRLSHDANSVLTAREGVRHVLTLLTQDIKQIEEMKASVKDEDVKRFDKAAESSRRNIHEALQKARTVINLDASRDQSQVIPETDGNQVTPDIPDPNKNMALEHPLQESLLIHDTEKLREQAQDLESLARDMQDLKEMMEVLSGNIAEQGEALEAIEHHVATAAANVTRGELLLAQARYLKTAALPIVGLTVGFAAGGPIGAVAGVRVGFAASMVGGAIGYAGGKVLHKFNNMNPLGPRLRAPAIEPPGSQEVHHARR